MRHQKKYGPENAHPLSQHHTLTLHLGASLCIYDSQEFGPVTNPGYMAYYFTRKNIAVCAERALIFLSFLGLLVQTKENHPKHQGLKPPRKRLGLRTRRPPTDPQFSIIFKVTKNAKRCQNPIFCHVFCQFWAYFGVCRVFLSCRGSRCSQVLVRKHQESPT